MNSKFLLGLNFFLMFSFMRQTRDTEWKLEVNENCSWASRLLPATT